MTLFRLGAAAAAALTLTTAVSLAGGSPTRTIEVPADAVVLVLPPSGGPPPMPGGAMWPAGFVSPFAMMQQMDRMMDAAFGGGAPDALMQAAMRQMEPGGMPSSVTVMSFSNGQGSCTRRVVYAGQDAPRVWMTGNACPQEATPAAQPAPAAPARTLRVDRARRAPIQMAQLDP